MPAMTSLCWCSSIGCGNSGPPSCQATEIGPDRAVLISRQPSRASRALSWLHVRHHPGDVADRARRLTPYAAARRSSIAWTWPSSTTTGPQAAKAAEWSNTTSSVLLAVDGQDELLERHVLDDLERADAEVLRPTASCAESRSSTQ